MKKKITALAVIALINFPCVADDRSDLIEAEMQKMTNKIELLEHEVRLLKQYVNVPSSSVASSVAENSTKQNKSYSTTEKRTDSDMINESDISGKKDISSEKQAYDLALATLKDKKYESAKEQFADFMVTYPKSSLLDRAIFWYSESFFAQKDFQNAALNYLKCYQKFPKGQKAADTLLKLAISLSELKRKAEVCKIIKKLENEFPNRSASAKKSASDLKLKHSCK
jgi:tol-pal system protein YbgF